LRTNRTGERRPVVQGTRNKGRDNSTRQEQYPRLGLRGETMGCTMEKLGTETTPGRVQRWGNRREKGAEKKNGRCKGRTTGEDRANKQKTNCVEESKLRKTDMKKNQNIGTPRNTTTGKDQNQTKKQGGGASYPRESHQGEGKHTCKEHRTRKETPPKRNASPVNEARSV